MSASPAGPQSHLLQYWIYMFDFCAQTQRTGTCFRSMSVFPWFSFMISFYQMMNPTKKKKSQWWPAAVSASAPAQGTKVSCKGSMSRSSHFLRPHTEQQWESPKTPQFSVILNSQMVSYIEKKIFPWVSLLDQCLITFLAEILRAIKVPVIIPRTQKDTINVCVEGKLHFCSAKGIRVKHGVKSDIEKQVLFHTP